MPGTESSGCERPIIQQILDKMLEMLESESVFDEKGIEDLRRLAENHELSRATKVEAAIETAARR